jgi:SAM-dependent methyltransferase
MLAWCLSTKRDDVILKVMLFLLLFIGVRYITNPWSKRQVYKEGFDQPQKYSLVRGQEVYDTFYVEMYDLLHKSKRRAKCELDGIEKALQLDKANASILDIGCGTGCMIAELEKRGYQNVRGVDQSEAMVAMSPVGSKVQCGDVKEPLLFERGRFTHLFCLYFTVYAFEDKIPFFHNCSQWLMPYGTLVIHLADPEKFDRIAPGVKSQHLPFHPTKGMKFGQQNEEEKKEEKQKEEKEEKEKKEKQKQKNELQTTQVRFPGFDYLFQVSDVNAHHEVYTRERFIDKKTGHIRENEQEWFMEPIDTILAFAATAGFVVKGKFDLVEFNKDPYQYIYLLEKVR